jgi:zinc transport system ATP-binding protein
VKALEIRNLYVERSNDLVIENANFTINKGDYVGIVGPNGGGKTTLILAILGILPKQRGTIRLLGEEIDSFSDWNKVAYVSQDATNFDPSFPLTVKELVSLGRLSRSNIGRRLKKEDWEAVENALNSMDISEIANKRIGQLSGGQKQRVFVAKALVRDPEMILLDEPVTGVDATTQEKFYQRLCDLNTNSGLTVLIATHDLTAVFCKMSKVMCVNRTVNVAEITEDLEPDKCLKNAYGDHFHLVYHKSASGWVFEK